ncbi:MAG: hypothetical protein FJ349_09770, partial [Sphingomonadales bacterium]|nr:hypothetical protein [Sphingomonadales bacterium]
YQWQSSTDNSTFTDISGATTDVYDAPNGLTTTTYYRRIVTSTLNSVACTATSNVLTVTVNSVTAGTVGSNQTLLCNGGNPAEFTELTAATGSGTLTYQWQSSTNNNAFTNIGSATSSTYDAPNGLTVTTYYRRITTSTSSSVACTTTSNVITVTVPALLTVADEGVSDASCANLTDGAIAIGVTGGTGAYTYAWTGTGGFTSSSEDQNYNLAPGTYAVTVTDANGCTASLTNLVVSSPSAVTISLSSTNPSCFGGTNGSVTATVSGGSPGYSFQWIKNGSNYATTPNSITGLGTGVYSVNVSDANLCTFSSSTVTISAPAALSATVAAASASVCSGANAVFTITGTGSQVVTYTINGTSATATLSSGTATVTINNATTTQTLTLVSVSNGACSNAVSGNASVSILDLP